MPDVQEVFRMSTQKVRQDPDAMERQLGRQRRAVRNRKAGTFVVVGCIAVAVLVLVASNVTRQEGSTVATQPPQITAQTGPQFVDLPTGEMSPLPENIGGAAGYAVSPDGTMFASNPCCTPPVAVSVANIDGTDARQVTPDDVDAYFARWLPDGESLVYQGRDATTEEIGNLFVVNIVTGETTQITDLEPLSYGDWFLSPEPSPDGRTVLFHMPRNTAGIPRWDLWSIPVTGGEPTLERRNAGVGVYAPTGEIAFLGSPEGFSSPTLVCRCSDGTRIVYADGGDIHILELATGVSSVVAEGASAEWFDDDTLVVVPEY